jgi:hypothetical protein
MTTQEHDRQVAEAKAWLKRQAQIIAMRDDAVALSNAVRLFRAIGLKPKIFDDPPEWYYGDGDKI